MILDHIILIPIGFVIASFASLIGIGGGLLWAPYFIFFKGFDPQKAIMFSFLIQFVGMGSATFWNMRHRFIFWRVVLLLLPFIIFGVVIGGYVSQRVVDASILGGALGVVSIFVSLFFAFQTEKYDTTLVINHSLKPPWWLKAQSLFFGMVSGVFSVGIGDFLIPVFRSRLKIPMKYSIGSSLFLNFILAIIGAVVHLSFSRYVFTPDMVYILIFSWMGVFLGGQMGPKLANIINENRLKEIFIFVLLLIGIHLIYKSL